MEKIRQKAAQAITDGQSIAHDVAAQYGQIFENVKRTAWFLDAVTEELEQSERGTK